MPKILGTFVAVAVIASGGTASAEACDATGFNDLTAALVNPSGTVSGVVDATGCDIAVFYDAGEGRVEGAQISGAKWYGVVVNGDASSVAVDILDSTISQIGDGPLTGAQHGVAIYYRAFFSAGTATDRISGNTISQYQKGGIVANGPGTGVQVMDNVVTGLGPVVFIAQNGIQIGYGATASVMKNTVAENSYTGTSTVSGGIVVVGGAGCGPCPDGRVATRNDRRVRPLTESVTRVERWRQLGNRTSTCSTRSTQPTQSTSAPQHPPHTPE